MVIVNKCTLKKNITSTIFTGDERDEDGGHTEIVSGNKACAKTVIYHEDCEYNFVGILLIKGIQKF